MMRLLLPALFGLGLLAACGPTIPGAIWYPEMEVICDDGACPRCHGSGGRMCPPCRGAGEVKCDNCRDGTQRCWTCGGDGRKKGKPCKSRDATGRTTCYSCGGDRMEKCEDCDGQTKVMCLRLLHVPVPEILDPAEAWPPGNMREMEPPK